MHFCWRSYFALHYVNSGLFKTAIRTIVKVKAMCSNSELRPLLFEILKTPVLPELVSRVEIENEISQQTEQILGPFILHDFFLFYFVKFGFSVVKIKFLAMQVFPIVFLKLELKERCACLWKVFFHSSLSALASRRGQVCFEISLAGKTGFSVASDCSSECYLNEI